MITSFEPLLVALRCRQLAAAPRRPAVNEQLVPSLAAALVTHPRCNERRKTLDRLCPCLDALVDLARHATGGAGRVMLRPASLRDSYNRTLSIGACGSRSAAEWSGSGP